MPPSSKSSINHHMDRKRIKCLQDLIQQNWLVGEGFDRYAHELITKGYYILLAFTIK